jgi:hypothetical protein
LICRSGATPQVTVFNPIFCTLEPTCRHGETFRLALVAGACRQVTGFMETFSLVSKLRV